MNYDVPVVVTDLEGVQDLKEDAKIMIEYFCVGSRWCLRKAVTGCEMCFRQICFKHRHIIHPTKSDFQICTKCKKDYDDE